MSSSHPNLIEVLDDRVQALFAAGQIEDAVRITQTALDSARRAASHDAENAPSLATALEVMADLRRAQGDFEQSQGLYAEALDFFDPETMPPEQYARLKSGLAALYDGAQLQEDAVTHYEEAIKLFENLEGDYNTQVAKLCNNVAMLYKEMGRHEDAEGRYIAAVQMFETAHGKNSTEAATVYNNLGGLYSLSGYPEQARGMHKIAFEIRSAAFEGNNPEIAQSLCNLATVSHELQEFKDAMVNYEKALKIFERNLPQETENYTITASNLAALLREQGLDRKASSLERQANKILKKALKK
ncbi:MAG: tetratricopeptide repeat protein [Verrucomicrobiales bacterium]